MVYYTILYYTILYYTILYYTILYTYIYIYITIIAPLATPRRHRTPPRPTTVWPHTNTQLTFQVHTYI